MSEYLTHNTETPPTIDQPKPRIIGEIDERQYREMDDRGPGKEYNDLGLPKEIEEALGRCATEKYVECVVVVNFKNEDGTTVRRYATLAEKDFGTTVRNPEEHGLPALEEHGDSEDKAEVMEKTRLGIIKEQSRLDIEKISREFKNEINESVPSISKIFENLDKNLDVSYQLDGLVGMIDDLRVYLNLLSNNNDPTNLQNNLFSIESRWTDYYESYNRQLNSGSNTDRQTNSSNLTSRFDELKTASNQTLSEIKTVRQESNLPAGTIKDESFIEQKVSERGVVASDEQIQQCDQEMINEEEFASEANEKLKIVNSALEDFNREINMIDSHTQEMSGMYTLNTLQGLLEDLKRNSADYYVISAIQQGLNNMETGLRDYQNSSNIARKKLGECKQYLSEFFSQMQ